MMTRGESAASSGREKRADKKPRKATAEATAPADKATMVVTLYDGTREPIKGKDFLIRIFDGFQNQLFDKERPAPTTVFHLPYRDNLQDNCTVLASGDGYVDAGFTPVKLSLKAVAMVDRLDHCERDPHGPGAHAAGAFRRHQRPRHRARGRRCLTQKPGEANPRRNGAAGVHCRRPAVLRGARHRQDAQRLQTLAKGFDRIDECVRLEILDESVIRL